MTAVAAVAADAVGAVALPASASAADHHCPGRARAAVYVSSVRYDSPGRDRSNWSLSQEWADVTNSTRRAVNLDGWFLRDEDGHTFTFRHVRLAGRSAVRVHTGVGHDTRTDLFQDRREYVWNNDHDTATLRNDRGRFVDDVSWGRRRGHRR
ncbi:lamin tail domain-containing protein [Streptomyces sp. NPDC090057]|uniref:lamin tail domain-containing protein n=1 Tax=Streptomyces sp. NPDC090057 TaxID=3365935 RepID=UPI00382F6B81